MPLDPHHLAALLSGATVKLPLRVDGLHEAYDDEPPGIDYIEDAQGDRVVVADSGVYPPTKPDADLIVAAVNALPELLEVMRAAVMVRDEWLGPGASAMTVTTPMFCALNDLAAAIGSTRGGGK